MLPAPIALITGASRGLGRSMALAFAKKGYAIGINYIQHESEAEAVRDQIKSLGQPALLVKADVRSSSDVDAMIKKIETEWGCIDVLINNAGLVRNKTLARMKDEDWREVMAVNLDGVFYCTRAVIPLMRAQKNGAIINISSYVAPRGVVGAANYAAAKAGVITLTKNTALEEGRYNIRANAVMPGFHVTDINQEVWRKYESQIRSQHLLSEMPNREELADFVVHVAQLKTVTGQVFAFESRLL